MSERQTINDLLMEVAKLRKDADYLKGELGYWKQQAQRIDSVSRGCDTDSREKLMERTCTMIELDRYDDMQPHYRCSSCGYKNFKEEVPNYCPNCGAKVVDA